MSYVTLYLVTVLYNTEMHLSKKNKQTEMHDSSMTN